MISVLILTKNEELDLPGCLESLCWCDDIHVVDSGSSDRTTEIAHRQGAQIMVNPFTSFAQQRNWALDNCPARNEWILFLDADERSSFSFQSAVLDAIQSASNEVAGFYCCWKTMLGNKWLRRADNFPKWQFRILRHGRARFADSGHGQKEGFVDGTIAYISEPYLHFAFSRGWDLWMEKHVVYARKDAAEMLKQRVTKGSLFSSHGSQRNMAIKRLVRRIPGWPLLRFVYTYLFKGGFLEGKEGLSYCRKMMWYERQIKLQLLLLRRVERN
jgi:glycosyltransferase involved in cell wall biosynthesis